MRGLFSLQLDESTDVSDTAQLCIFIRMVFTDMTAKEELLTLLPMKEHTRGEDIFQSFNNFIAKTQLPVHKLVSITTDGAQAMVGRVNGFIAKCREDDAFAEALVLQFDTGLETLGHMTWKLLKER